jgi:hypothetical protein
MLVELLLLITYWCWGLAYSWETAQQQAIPPPTEVLRRMSRRQLGGMGVGELGVAALREV